MIKWLWLRFRICRTRPRSTKHAIQRFRERVAPDGSARSSMLLQHRKA